jgi:prevent-host-death family protein
MERSVGVEQARGELGRLAASVAAGEEPVVLTRRGRAEAVLVGRDEYAEFKLKRSEAARAELAKRLDEVRERIERSGLDAAVVEEAIAAARQLD